MSGFSAGIGSPNEALDNVSSEEIEAAVPAEAEAATEALSAHDEEPVDEPVEEVVSETEEVPEVAAEASEEEAEVKDKKGANSRIRQLVEERNALNERYEQQQAHYARQMQTMQMQMQEQYAAQQTALQEQNRMLQEQLSMSRDRYDREEYEKMPLAKQVELDAVKRARQENEQFVNQRLSGYEKALQEERSARAQMEENFKRQERMNRLKEQVTEGRGVIFKGVPETDLGETSEILNDMFLGYAGGKGVYPKDAAPVFRKAMEQWAKAYYKNLAAQSKQQVQKSKGVPSVGGSARKSGSSGGAVKVQKTLPADGRRDMDSLFDHFAKQAFHE